MTFEKFLFDVVEATKPNQALHVQIGKLQAIYAVFELKETINAKLFNAIKQTIAENGHLADGEKCTLWRLKQAIGM